MRLLVQYHFLRYFDKNDVVSRRFEIPVQLSKAFWLAIYTTYSVISTPRCRYGTSKIYLSSKSPLLSCEKNQQLPRIRLARVGTQARSEAALRYFRVRVSFKVSRVILKCTVYNDSGVLHDFGSLWESSKTKRHEKITIRRKIKDLWRYCSKKIMRQKVN